MDHRFNTIQRRTLFFTQVGNLDWSSKPSDEDNACASVVHYYCWFCHHYYLSSLLLLLFFKTISWKPHFLYVCVRLSHTHTHTHTTHTHTRGRERHTHTQIEKETHAHTNTHERERDRDRQTEDYMHRHRSLCCLCSFVRGLRPGDVPHQALLPNIRVQILRCTAWEDVRGAGRGDSLCCPSGLDGRHVLSPFLRAMANICTCAQGDHGQDYVVSVSALSDCCDWPFLSAVTVSTFHNSANLRRRGSPFWFHPYQECSACFVFLFFLLWVRPQPSCWLLYYCTAFTRYLFLFQNHWPLYLLLWKVRDLSACYAHSDREHQRRMCTSVSEEVKVPLTLPRPGVELSLAAFVAWVKIQQTGPWGHL